MNSRVIALLVAFVAVSAVPTALHHGEVDFEIMAQTVNRLQGSWTAEAPSRFSHVDEVRQLCGTWTKGHAKHVDHKLEVMDSDPSYIATDIPSSFDARTHWSNCSTIATVRDQSACGSCWAFGSTEAFEDSRCAATGEDILFSTYDTAGCCSGLMCGFSQGCNGGQPSSALRWMTRTGVVTGGSYFDIGKGSSCKPYEFQPCAHHVPATSKYPKCPDDEYSTDCKAGCSESSYSKSYAADKTKAAQSFSLQSVEGMQTAIMTTGPLAVAFTVYADFPTYKSGVYTHTSGEALGGHAVEMVGWGTEDGNDYWLIKNSWNEQWGDGGFFKIARGTDECGIEDDVTGVKF